MQMSMLLLLVIAVSVSQSQRNRDWHIGIDRVNPRGAVIHGHANLPFYRDMNGRLNGNIHGSRVFGGPYNRAQTVGGGLQYQHRSGLHGGLDATHRRGYGNSYSATLGGSRRLGPGTLFLDGSAYQGPGSRRINGQVGATYKVPF